MVWGGVRGVWEFGQGVTEGRVGQPLFLLPNLYC